MSESNYDWFKCHETVHQDIYRKAAELERQEILEMIDCVDKDSFQLGRSRHAAISLIKAEIRARGEPGENENE